MGVPAFFKWICIRCPKILQDAIDDVPEELLEEGGYINQPQLEIDNLYLDMNGIIHPCTHPEHLPIPKPLTEEDMFNNIFKYIDKIVRMVKPRKLIYFAVDGVAPRAKMNQQRGRRFRAAQEAVKIIEKKEALKKEWQERGQDYPDELEEDFNNKFDSNVITPGTEFMHRMSKAVEYYITERLNNDPMFRNLKCIFSDANIPGEGEHKILHFVRQQRALEGYDPNTRHCLYGADADLIMLGLSTHEPYFYILRETVMTKKEINDISGNIKGEEKEGEFHEKAKKEIPIHFQFIKLHAFREYLDYEFKYLDIPFPYNLEGVIDDFVFMCFFVGNDFLPHLPCLTIREGGIDSLLYLYKRILPFLGGYFIDNGELNLMRVDVLLREIGQIEEALLRSAARSKEFQKNRQNRGGRGGRDGNMGWKGKKEYLDRNDRGERNDREDRGDRNDRGDRYDNRDRSRGDRYDRDRSDRGDRYDNRDRNDRGDRYDRDRSRGDRYDDREDRYNRDRSRGDRYDDRGDRYDRNDRGYRNDRGDRSGWEDRGNRNEGNDDREKEKNNRAAANLIREQIMGSVKPTDESLLPEQPEKAKEAVEPSDRMEEIKDTTTSASPKEDTKDQGVSLDDWSRDVEEEEKMEKMEKPKSPQITIPPAVEKELTQEVLEVQTEASEKLQKLISNITDMSEERPLIQTEEVVLEPRVRFNQELQKKIRDDGQGDETIDDFRPGFFGFKQAYYFEKFKIMPHEFPEFRKLIQKAYCEALCWVFAYYYKGCISWNWYYPFNYTPFISDIAGIDKVDIQFETGEPFTPVAQLLAVLPPYSSKAVPPCMRSLMLDDDSEIIDFYPRDFFVDLKGKRFAWMGEVIVPFIEEERLLNAMNKRLSQLTPSEQRRNSMGTTRIYVRQDNELVNAIREQNSANELLTPEQAIDIEYSKAKLGGKFKGMVQKYQLDKDYPKPDSYDAVTIITKNQAVALVFEDPLYKPHVCKILEGVTMPDLLMSDEAFENIDRKFMAGERTIGLIKRTLGIRDDDGGYNNRGGGYLNRSQGGQGIYTGYGITHQTDRRQHFNTFFNNNRAIEQQPTQFKRVVPNQYYQQQQQQQQHQQPQYPQQNQPGYPPNMPPMNQMGGNMPYNPHGYNPQPPSRDNRFGSLNQNLQNQSNPYDLLNKRDRPNQQRSPDERYGDQVRKQQFH